MNTNKKALLAVALVALMLAVPFTIMGGTEDSSATSTVPTGNSYIYTLNTSTWAATKDGSSATALTGWEFDTGTGLGPFNSFYAAINTPSSVANADANRLSDTIGKIAYILNPNNLTQGKVGSSWEAISNINTYNIMWVVPTVYWKVSGTTLTMSNDPANGGQAYAHTFSGVTYPYIAIGVYEATVHSDGLGSRNGVSPAGSKTVDQFRDLASLSNQTTDVGTYILWDFDIWTMYKAMSMTVMGSKDSQNAVNYGNANSGTAASTTGLGNSTGYYGGNGSSSSTSTATTYSKLFIENSWGSVIEFVDNAYLDASYTIQYGHSLSNEQNISTPSITGTKATATINWGTLSKENGWKYGQNYSSAATFGFQTGTLSTTANGDGICLSGTAKNCIFIVGGAWNDGVNAGLSSAYVNGGVALSYPHIGARLAYVMTADAAVAEPFYTINYRAMDGSAIAGTDPTTGREGVAHALPAAPATPAGYGSFIGWYTAPAGGFYAGMAGDSYTPASSLNLYAVFSPVTVSVHSETINFHEWNNAATTYAATSKTLAGLTNGTNSIIPTPVTSVVQSGSDNYRFIGWTTTAPASLTTIAVDNFDYAAGNPYLTTIATTATADVVTNMYAVYELTTETVYTEAISFYEYNGTAYAQTSLSMTGLTDGQNSIVPTPINSVVVSGDVSYKFVGWSMDAVTAIGTGTVAYAPGNPYVTSITGSDDKATSLYAVYERVTPYTETITFYEWNGTAYDTTGKTMSGLTNGMNSEVATPFATIVASGDDSYKFVGWSTAVVAAIGTGTVTYVPGNPYVTTITSDANIMTTFYAVYERVTATVDQVTITFKDATAAITDMYVSPGYTTSAATGTEGQIEYPAGQALRLPGYSPANAVFLGWYTAATDGNLIGKEGDVIALNADITMFARTAAQVTVSFVNESTDSEATLTNETIQTYDGATITLPNYSALQTGYVLKGWKVSGDTSNTIVGTYGSKYTVTDNVTLKAVTMQLSSSGGSADLEVYSVSAGTLSIGGTPSTDAISTAFDMVLPAQILPGTHGLIMISPVAGGNYKVNALTAVDDTAVDGTGSAVLVQLDQYRWMIQSVTGAVKINVDASAVTAADYGFKEFYISGLTGSASNANTGAVVKLVGGENGLAAGTVGIRGTYVISTEDATTHVVTRTYGQIEQQNIGAVTAGLSEFVGNFTLTQAGAYIYCISGSYDGDGFSVETPMVLAPRAA